MLNDQLNICFLTEVKPCFTYLRNLTYFSVQPVSQLVKKVKIVEVGPRDGLQNEKVYNVLKMHLSLVPVERGGVTPWD